MDAPIVNLEYIKMLRKNLDISIEEMSIALGHEGYQGYYYKERGIRKMSAEDIAQIAIILKVPIASLFYNQVVTEKVTS